ncbi:protein ALP1-like [Malania oleifera]|uniref:protein ALP1-like n=1 Tax=Malania oleifera TaxID=397392 RepID=UPI0025ADCCD3|nr:protein ALP1-like [Malania oleifera]
MEMTSFSALLNQDDYSNFYSIFQDMDAHNITTGTTATRKRRRKGDGDGDEVEGSGKVALKEILASLLLLDEEEKTEQQKWAMDSQHQKSLIDANYQHTHQAMQEYNLQLQHRFSNSDEHDRLRLKRARGSTSAALGAAAIASEDSNSNVSNSNSDTQSPPAGGGARRLWVKDRSKAWWEMCSSPDFPDEDFKRAFRMSRPTFDFICGELDSAVTKKDTMLRAAIPVRQRVAVCIWRLATGEPLRLVSKRFGLGISTCHKLVLEVCSAIRAVLMPKFLQWPDDARLNTIKTGFESISRIPNVGGSMYTTHVPIIAPKISVAAYFNKRHTERNQKTSYSITVQGVVDHTGVFTDVCIGWPGSMQDDQVLEKSALFQRANRGLLKDVWMVGNSGFALMDWVLVPYNHQNLTWTQHAFNERIGEAQRVAKEAFGRLKGRWACLQKRTEVKLEDLPVLLGACCVLHNICEMRGEEVEPELMGFELFDDETVPENAVRSTEAARARDHIAHNLLHHSLAGTGFL